MCIYKNDDVEHFVDAINSITTQQKGVSQESIRTYLHIDGDVSDKMEETIKNLNIYKVIRSDKNIGLAAGLNKLINSLEDEKYAFRMDADDISLERRISIQSEYLDLNSEIDFCGGGMKEFLGETNNIVNSRNYPSTKHDIDTYMNKASPFSHVTVCFRVASLVHVGLYPTGYPLNEDIALWFQAYRNSCSYSNIPDSLCLVRMDGAYERRTYVKALSEFKVYKSIAKFNSRTPLYAYSRLLFRLSPGFLVKFIYESPVRRFFLEREPK
ncbi:hypothetical protein A1QG_13555 [Vibrio breoganii ZF-29]|nr:hypothetical protein A1QG_13555 [Vibrio breoganii ZF-29]